MPGFHRATSSSPPQLETGPESKDVSGTYRSVGPAGPLTKTYWGLDLGKGLPCSLSSDGIAATRGELGRIRDFLTREFPSLTEEGLGSTPHSETLDAKRRYLHTNCDLFELRHHDDTVGVLIGEPEDWSSYYIRTLAIAQTYQRPSLIRRFVTACLGELLTTHRVERVGADTSPTNFAMARFLTEFRFHVTGHQLSERWGPMVRYTRFIDPACEAAFHAKFGGTTPAGSNSKRKEDKP